ncbi:MAG: helix-turn-helix transcriptional regulator, partial [Burkholderiaceae bacterium]
TILRDIDQLSAAGVPIWSDRGRAGGFQLREGWSTELTGLTQQEAGALFLAGLPGPATELGLSAAATSARLKMIASLPAEWREQADQVAARLHVDPTDWYRAQETPQFLREAADAVCNGYRIDVEYESWRGVSRRALEPLGLALKAGAWYLIARQEGKADALTFRLANIHTLSTTRRRFKRPSQFDLAAHWRNSIARFEADLHRLTAHIAVSPRGVKWLANARVKATPVPQPGQLSDSPAGWREYVLPIESIEHGVRQVLSYGAQVKLLGPPKLVEQFAQELAAIKALYKR